MLRSCGGCQMCCEVFPVPEVNKPKHTKCQHQCESGCSIHDQPRSPICTEYTCTWLGELTWPEQLRPDNNKICFARLRRLNHKGGKFFIAGMMHNPYAHLRKENVHLVERLKREGHIILLVYSGDDDEKEFHGYWDERRYRTLRLDDMIRLLNDVNVEK